VEVIHKLVQAKQGADLNTSTFNQLVAYEVGHGGFLDKHVMQIRKVYHERRDVMLESLGKYMPQGVKWTHPLGGLFLWASLPEGLNSTQILEDAIKQKVAYVPGDSFHPNGGGLNTMRLNFSYSKPEIIREGMARLGEVFRKWVK